MRFMSIILVSVISMLVSGCGGSGGGSNRGGGGNSSTGGVYFTHEELADEFVFRLNTDENFDLDLVKTNTEQYDYIVVYDYDFDTYDAYYIGDYNPGEDLIDYLFDFNNSFFYDLDPIGGGRYRDFVTGIIFEKTQPTPKDLLKLKALKEAVQIKKSAEYIAAEYGLSENRSLEVAKLSKLWKNTPKDRMTDQDHDHFAQEVLGYSITEYKQAVKSMQEGDKSHLKNLVRGTADFNGTTPEDMNDIIKSVFNVSVFD